MIRFRTFKRPVFFRVDERGRPVDVRLGEPVYDPPQAPPSISPTDTLKDLPDYPLFRWYRR